MGEILSPKAVNSLYSSHDVVKQRADQALTTRQQYMMAIAELAPHLPQLPDSDADTIYAQIEEAERRLAPSLSQSEYHHGGADYEDQIWSAHGETPLLLTADHATDPIRKATGLRGDADHGTGGLVLALANNKSLSVALPAGRQAGNANVDLEHKLKDTIQEALPSQEAFVSVHGMKPGKFVHQFDETEIHGVLGLGEKPTDSARDVAQRLIDHALEEYGLKLVVGNDMRFFDQTEHSPRIDYDESGEPVYSARLAAAGEGSTTSFVNRRVDNPLFPALQIEISRTLRLLPNEMEYRDVRNKVMSVYMGYRLTQDLVELALDR